MITVIFEDGTSVRCADGTPVFSAYPGKYPCHPTEAEWHAGQHGSYYGLCGWRLWSGGLHAGFLREHAAEDPSLVYRSPCWIWRLVGRDEQTGALLGRWERVKVETYEEQIAALERLGVPVNVSVRLPGYADKIELTFTVDEKKAIES